MNYECKTCNYATYDKFNYNKHLITKKHKQKVNQDANHTICIPISYSNHTEIVEDKCQFCEKTFANSSSLARHRKICNIKNDLIKSYEERLEKQATIIKNKDELIKVKEESYIKEIKVKEESYIKEIKAKDDYIDLLRSENRNLRTLLNNAGSVIKTSVSTLSYIVTNYTEAPALEPIRELPKLHYEMTDMEFVDRLILEYRHQTLTPYIGDLILKSYKKDDPRQQSIWNSDTSRLTYIIREIMHNQNLDWRVDKKGLKTSKYIVEPVLDYIDECITKYLKKSKAANRSDSTNQAIKIMNNFADAGKILQMIEDKILEDDILKYLAPHLYVVKDDALLIEE
jgi:hypothetical protein